ncbi:hypothetical protein WOLCODRAFT_144374 [Wolfiporia cocos MD-104 SS10]|uniref:Uncharacterized protein n=1 Tax=Wolfiporia cocos (strain MD-104) TaxID=742152 RepID=A0A2H3JT27_WOLCO|nr:hypothetical protein WOLCODRAFT_144374 [Wolfiporia cocos MD-104 SS10]
MEDGTIQDATRAGNQTHTSRVRKFSPALCLHRSITLLTLYLFFHKDDVHKALASGALVLIARSSNWEPSQSEDGDFVFVKLPDQFESIDEHERPGIHEVETEYSCIEGNTALPHGYHWVFAPERVTKTVIDCELENTDKIVLGRYQSWAKPIISLVQLFNSAVTLYNAHGDQISRFGVAAYGLSVSPSPYMIMSAANLIAVAFVGEYPVLYALTTSITEEVKSRDRRQLRTSFGFLKQDVVEMEMRAREGCNAVKSTSLNMSLTASKMRTEDDGQGGKTLIVSVGDIQKRFKLHPDDPELETSPRHYHLGICSITNRPLVELDSESSPLRHALDYTPILFMIILAIVVVIIYWSMTGFSTAASTPAEQIWAVGWQVSGTISCILFSAYATRNGYRLFYLLRKKYLPVATLMILAVLPIGGYVQLIRMYMEDHGNAYQ